MWFILLFAICGLAIPVVLEIYVRGDDNILSRSGSDLARSTLARNLTRVTGITVGWVTSLVVLVFVFVLFRILIWFLLWLLGLFF